MYALFKKVLLISVAAATISACGNGAPAEAEPPKAAVAEAWPAVNPAALRSVASDERLRRFYEARGWRAAWTAEQARSLMAALEDSKRHGLDKSMFLDMNGIQAGGAEREAALTRAALSYADALADGVVDPAKIREVYTVPRPPADVVGGLLKVVEQGKAADWLLSLAPSDPAYQALSDAYLHYSRQAGREQGRTIESGDMIREGDTDPRVPKILQALRENGYLPQTAGSGSPADRYAPQIAEAVARMQADYGIASDGIVGPDTLDLLNTGAADRARQLAVNMERRRWLERNPPATRIDVNTAAALLRYWKDGAQVDERAVIVGQPDWETPQLGSPIFRLVANPTWTVPKSIEEEEIAPKGEAYLRRNNMERRNGWVVQLPGPENALGQVKFDMHNKHAIYLHDTPAKHLFGRNQRHFSHGCVRVQKALEFARVLADHDGKRDQFEKALASGDETFVDLDRDVPVRLVYHTAFADSAGKVAFRNDPYGWDGDVAEALGLEAPRSEKRKVHASDVGP